MTPQSCLSISPWTLVHCRVCRRLREAVSCLHKALQRGFGAAQWTLYKVQPILKARSPIRSIGADN
jgi:hypothetical protein